MSKQRLEAFICSDGITRFSICHVSACTFVIIVWFTPQAVQLRSWRSGMSLEKRRWEPQSLRLKRLFVELAYLCHCFLVKDLVSNHWWHFNLLSLVLKCMDLFSKFFCQKLNFHLNQSFLFSACTELVDITALIVKRWFKKKKRRLTLISYCSAQEEKEAQTSARSPSRTCSTWAHIARRGQGPAEWLSCQRLSNGRRVSWFAEWTLGLCLPGCSRAGLWTCYIWNHR